MKSLVSITLATLVIGASSLAQANDVERYGRASPTPGIGSDAMVRSASRDVAAVQGRASIVPDTGFSVAVRSPGPSIDVASVLGRASGSPNALEDKGDVTFTARSDADVQGR